MRQQLASTNGPVPPTWTRHELQQNQSFRSGIGDPSETGRARCVDESIEERRVLSDANGALRNAFQLTEEEAYARLHETSRRTRKRLIDVARRILEDWQETSFDETTLGLIVRHKLSALETRSGIAGRV